MTTKKHDPSYEEKIERLARIIDPEAFGLPDNLEPNTLTDRDAARDRARLILCEFVDEKAGS